MNKIEQNVSYHESLLERLERPHFIDAPHVYQANESLIDAINSGEEISERQVFEEYFETLERDDVEYMRQIKRIIKERQQHFDQIDFRNRKVQYVIPAYREGENIEEFLASLEKQLVNGEANWGVTFVIDYSVPYKNPYEYSAKQRMLDAIDSFRVEHPDYASRIDYMHFTRRKDTKTPILPVGLARKVGEDVLMYERYVSMQQDVSSTTPLYLGLMDIDTGDLSDGLLSNIAETVPESENDVPMVVRVRGSYDRKDVRNHLYLHPLQMMWEGPTSEVAKNTRYNPFNVGRLSAVPAKELALTGGGFAWKLEFPDEDIRHGIQIAWRLKNTRSVEVPGKYATSGRREIGTMQSILQLLEDNGGVFDKETLECASLIRMYGNWAGNTFRREFGNIQQSQSGDDIDPLFDSTRFNSVVPPILIEAMTNAGYRFTTFVMYAVDELAESPLSSEIGYLKQQFLAGRIPHFRLELDTLEFISTVSKTNNGRFEDLKSVLAVADQKARASIVKILIENQVNFDLEESGPLYGLLEEEDSENPDRTIMIAPFKIASDQKRYMNKIREEMT